MDLARWAGQDADSPSDISGQPVQSPVRTQSSDRMGPLVWCQGINVFLLSTYKPKKQSMSSTLCWYGQCLHNHANAAGREIFILILRWISKEAKPGSGQYICPGQSEDWSRQVLSMLLSRVDNVEKMIDEMKTYCASRIASGTSVEIQARLAAKCRSKEVHIWHSTV